MGTKLALSYSNIFMSHFEEKYVNPHHNLPLLWKRFIDATFLIWTHGMNKLMQFITHLATSELLSVHMGLNNLPLNSYIADLTVDLENNTNTFHYQIHF